jgi:hypothetical protein
MPILQVNLSDAADVRAGIKALSRLQANGAPGPKAPRASRKQRLAHAMTSMKSKKIWKFLDRAANLQAREWSLPELGTHLGLSSGKVSSLKAILAKPERRLGVQFFELAPDAAADAAGNPRYRMPDAIRQAIQKA